MSATLKSIFLLFLAVVGGLSLPFRAALQRNMLSGLESEDVIPEGREADGGRDARSDPDSMVPQIPLPAAFEGDDHSRRIDPDAGEPSDGYPSIKSPPIGISSDPVDETMFAYQPVPKEDTFTRESLADEGEHLDNIQGMQTFLKDRDEGFGQGEETQVAEYPIGSVEPGTSGIRRGSYESNQDKIREADEMHYDPFGDYLPFAGGEEPLHDNQEQRSQFQGSLDSEDSHEQNLETSSSEMFNAPEDGNEKDSPQEDGGENLDNFELQDGDFDKNYIE